jgi:hypothetical protein
MKSRGRCRRCSPRGLYDEKISELTDVGRHLIEHPALPWLHAGHGDQTSDDRSPPDYSGFDELSGLGAAAAFAISCDTEDISFRKDLYLSAFPMPLQFRKLFQDWSEGLVNLVERPGDQQDFKAKPPTRSG